MSRAALILSAWVILPGCETKEAATPGSGSAPCSADYPNYAPGMTVKAGVLTAKLLSASPSPPRQKVPNHWNVELRDEQGKPVKDLTVSNPDSFMPVHNHHGRTPPTIAAASEPGGARLTDIDFNMRGPWQVLFDVQRPGAATATVTFQVCVR